MKTYKLRLSLFIGLLILLSSCDLLGIGNNDHKDHNKNAPKLVWKKPFTGQAKLSETGSAGPIIDQGNVYLLGFRLAKLKLKNGSTQWVYNIMNTPGTPGISPGARNFLLTDQEVVLALPKRILSLSQKDGKPLWKTPVSLASAQNENSKYENLRLPMTQTSSLVFIGGQNKMVGLNKNNGSIELTVPVDKLAPNGETVYVTHLVSSNNSTPLLFAATEYVTGKSQVPTFKGNIIAINPETGKTMWGVDLSTITKDGTLVSIATKLFFTGNQLVVLISSEVIALDPVTGNIKWQTSLGSANLILDGTVGAGGDHSIYVSIFSGDIVRLNAASGSILWKASTTSGISLGMAVDNEHLYYSVFSNQNGGIWMINTDQGKIKRVIRASDLKNVGLGFLIGSGISVKAPYLVKQGTTHTYGIKL